MRTSHTVFLAILLTVLPCGAFAQAPAASFRAGAAAVDITPVPLPKNIEGILDRIYARAIVIDNGVTSAALVSVDTGMLGEQVWGAVSQRIEKELGIPSQNLIMNPTHTHSAFGGSADQVFDAVKAAREKLQPARIGYGTGVSYINVNRNIIDRKTNKWWEGPNYDGPSDKTVAVIEFETTDGEPIELRMVPSGARLLVNLRPAQLWSSDPQMAELRASLTQDVTGWLETQLRSVCRHEPAEIEEVLLAWILGARGTQPQLAAVVHLARRPWPLEGDGPLGRLLLPDGAVRGEVAELRPHGVEKAQIGERSGLAVCIAAIAEIHLHDAPVVGQGLHRQPDVHAEPGHVGLPNVAEDEVARQVARDAELAGERLAEVGVEKETHKGIGEVVGERLRLGRAVIGGDGEIVPGEHRVDQGGQPFRGDAGAAGLDDGTGPRPAQRGGLEDGANAVALAHAPLVRGDEARRIGG